MLVELATLEHAWTCLQADFLRKRKVSEQPEAVSRVMEGACVSTKETIGRDVFYGTKWIVLNLVSMATCS